MSQDTATVDDASVGQMIRRSRQAAGMSQNEVASRMQALGHKWSQATVWALEQGRRDLKWEEGVDLGPMIGFGAPTSPDAQTVRDALAYRRVLDVVLDGRSDYGGRSLDGMFVPGIYAGVAEAREAIEAFQKRWGHAVPAPAGFLPRGRGSAVVDLEEAGEPTDLDGNPLGASAAVSEAKVEAAVTAFVSRPLGVGLRDGMRVALEAASAVKS